MATVVTALYGGVDELHPQAEQDFPVRWQCFTDDPDLKAPPPWQVIYRPSHLHPNLAAKRYKFLPSPMQRVVWIDANMQVESPSFVREALGCTNNGIALFRHPRRDCIYAEAEASLGAESQGGKYDDQPIPAQIDAYRQEGHPEHWGLWACGTIAWSGLDPLARLLARAWMVECQRWSYQDQLSFPVVCRRLGIVPGDFPHPQLERHLPLGNRWLTIHEHLSTLPQ